MRSRPLCQKHSTRNALKACALILCASALFTSSLSAQSVRRKLTDRVAPSPAMRALIESMPERDIDLYLGRIVRIDDEYAIVHVASSATVKNRAAVYYACDVTMTPTAILENMRVSHRACSTFRVVNGEARVGDTVMVKYLAPEKDDPNKSE